MSILGKARTFGLAAIVMASPAGLGCDASSVPSYAPGMHMAKSNSKPIEVNKDTFKKEVLESKIPVVVDFYHPQCYYCNLARTYMEKLAGEYSSRVKIAMYDCSKENNIPNIYGISAYPTFVFINNTKVNDRLVGFDKDQLDKKIKNHSKRK